MKKDSVFYKNGQLTIRYAYYGQYENRQYGDLFDWLGDFDIITASEIHRNYICMSEEVFVFSEDDEIHLEEYGEVKLNSIGFLDDILDLQNPHHLDFNNWYYNIA